MAGSINNVDPVFFLGGGAGHDRSPKGGGRRRNNGNAPLFFLLHPIHLGSAGINVAKLVGFTGIEQDPLGSGGFAGIDMGNDADVSD